MDIYGKCAKDFSKIFACPRNNISCIEEFGQQYYFFLALENTVCKDYITEKYWSRYYLPSIPIVMRRYLYQKLVN